MIEYLKNNAVAAMFSIAPSYKKKAQTLLRKPYVFEVGLEMPTFVKTDEGLRVESKTVIGETSVIARNTKVIAVIPELDNFQVHNEWPIQHEIAVTNYGANVIASLTGEFRPFQKCAMVKVVKLTKEVMNTLGVEGSTLEIKVDWSDKPMLAKIGDYLSDGGHSISKQDMKAYELI